MLYYSTLTFLCFVQYFFIRGLPPRIHKLTGLTLLSMFAAFAGLRGMVGTDTWLYAHVVRGLAEGKTVTFEPGFILTAEFFLRFMKNESVVVNAFSVIFFGLSAIYVLRASRSEMIYFFAYFAPQSFILYSFNGLRIGLASIAFILFLQYFRRDRHLICLSLIIFAISMHYTISFALLVFFAFRQPLLSRRAIFSRFIVLLFAASSVPLLAEYVMSRAEVYASFGRLDVLAGLSFLVKIPVFLFFIWQLPLGKKILVEKFVVACVLLVVGLLLTSQSYAGLRVLDILSWLIPLMFIYSLETDKETDRHFNTGLALVGFIGAVGVLRNIASSTAGGSPFLPYHFLWEIAR